MEDAATAEISRTQLWQWIHHAAKFEDGRAITLDMFNLMLQEEMKKLHGMVGDAAFEAGNYRRAGALLDDLVSAEDFMPFLTLQGYTFLN
jgi:malate synthase